MSESERQFLHDLSNPIAISLGNIKILHKRIKQDPAAFPHDAILERLEKALQAFNTMQELIAKRKTALADFGEQGEE